MARKVNWILFGMGMSMMYGGFQLTQGTFLRDFGWILIVIGIVLIMSSGMLKR